MDEMINGKDLGKLLGEIESLPLLKNRTIRSSIKISTNQQKVLRENLNSLKESLDNLRLIVKYQVFDLEATKRENQYLKKLLADKNSN